MAEKTPENQPPLMLVTVKAGCVADLSVPQLKRAIEASDDFRRPITIGREELEITCLWCKATGNGREPFQHLPECGPPAEPIGVILQLPPAADHVEMTPEVQAIVDAHNQHPVDALASDVAGLAQDLAAELQEAAAVEPPRRRDEPPVVYLRGLAERVMHIPIMYGVDCTDADALMSLARHLELRDEALPVHATQPYIEVTDVIGHIGRPDCDDPYCGSDFLMTGDEVLDLVDLCPEAAAPNRDHAGSSGPCGRFKVTVEFTPVVEKGATL